MSRLFNLIRNHGLGAVDVKYRSEPLCIYALRCTSKNFYDIPKLTEPIAFATVRADFRLWRELPNRLLTEPVLYEVIKKAPYEIEVIPDHLKSELVSVEALKRYRDSIDYVPRIMMLDPILVIYVTSHRNALKRVPIEYRSKLVCYAAVEHDRANIHYVPENILDVNLLHLADVWNNKPTMRSRVSSSDSD